MKIRYEPDHFQGKPYWILEDDWWVFAFIDEKPKRSTFADWRMALRRKLNGDTR